MADSATSRYGARQQSQGSNTNSWGDDKLNEVLRLLDRGSKGVQTLVMTGDQTLTWTNYVATNTGQCAVLLLTGALSSPASLVVPGVEWQWNVIKNSTGQAITVKTAAGAGVTIANGQYVSVYCDAADCYNGSPTTLPGAVTVAGKISGVTAGAASTDAVNKAQMETAIATAGLPATAGTVLNSASDTTAGYLGQKITVSGAIVKSTANPSANEGTHIEVWDGGLIDGGLQSASFSALAGRAYVAPTGGAIALATPEGSRRKIELALFGAGTTTLTGLIAGVSSIPIDGDQTITLTDASASRGWVMASSGKSGIHFSDPSEFLPMRALVASLSAADSADANQASSTTAFFTEMARRGATDTTNWVADTYKTILSVSSGKGFFAAYIGPTAGGSETHTIEFTVDDVVYPPITITGLSSGERAVLMPWVPVTADYTATNIAYQPGAEGLASDKATFAAIRVSSLVPPWHILGHIPLLKFRRNILVRAKHSASITNSTATAYSAAMYRLQLA